MWTTDYVSCKTQNWERKEKLRKKSKMSLWELGDYDVTQNDSSFVNFDVRVFQDM